MNKLIVYISAKQIDNFDKWSELWGYTTKELQEVKADKEGHHKFKVSSKSMQQEINETFNHL